jgi:hypothetical protein
MDVDIVSVGFRAFKGYNTVEVRERNSIGLMLPYEFFELAKDLRNRDYVINDLGLRGQSYVEIALGHSHQINDNLRVGAKVKALLGGGRAELTMNDMHATFREDKWLLQGQAKGELSLKGATFLTEHKDYESETRTGGYNQVNDIDVDGTGVSGFGLGVDLGAIYELKETGIDAINGLKVSASLNDLGFISWSNNLLVENNGKPFTFDGFKGVDVKKGDGRHTMSKEGDRIKDELTDFVALQDRGDQGSKSTALAATARLGVEYPLPMYNKVSFGLLGTHRFNGDYSWTEGRLSANWKPLKWLDGGINFAVGSLATSMGWVLNVHPKGFNFFIGMDHILGKTSAEFIPLSSRASANIGMNITW